MIEKLKNKIAIDKGYPNWEEMENWIIDINKDHPEVVAQLLVGAMEDVYWEQEKINSTNKNLK